jgi:hypothetical protein
MTIRFRCPHCKKPLGVKDHLAGKKAACPLCKKALVIPPLKQPPPVANQPAPVETPGMPEPPPEEVENLAASALADELAQTEEVERKIDFTCDFCETPISLPLSEAGKRIQCPNEECRRILKVPQPKEEDKKDWRKMAKKGPTIADIRQEEKIDEAAWGTQTDKGKVAKESLEQAGALPEKKREPVGVGGWIRRGFWTAVAVGGLGLAAYGLIQAHHAEVVRDNVKTIQDIVKSNPAMHPVVRAELMRGLGELLVNEGENKKAEEAVLKARAGMQGLKDIKVNVVRGESVDADLMLVDLAVTMTALGGSEQEKIREDKWMWETALKELRTTLESIRAPEARVIGVRNVASRLIDRDQADVAVGLATNGTDLDKRLGTPAQLVTLLLWKGREAILKDKVQPPNPKVPLDPLARTGYAEFNARKKEIKDALELVQTKGQPRDIAEAGIGVAEVLLGDRKNPKAAEDAVQFAEEALKQVPDPKKPPGWLTPWQHLQLVRVGARTKGTAAVQELAKSISPPCRPRAHLEMLLAEAEKATTPLDFKVLQDFEEVDKDGPCLDLAWEAVARNHARCGSDTEIRNRAETVENGRFKPMVRLGLVLGALDRKK